MSSTSRREGGAQLLQELEALSQALYKAPPPQLQQEPRRDFEGRVLPSRRRASEAGARIPSASTPESRHSISVPPNSGATAIFDKDEPEFLDENAPNIEVHTHKKSSFWDWKPLRALAHIGQQRFHCEFSAHVHGIEKLPASMNGLRLQVHLRHRDAGVHTMPARASHGSVEFEETMQFRCNVYGSKKSNGTIKYMSKSFDLFVVAMDVAELDLGKHKLDLSRILPSSSSASTTDGNNTWNTSFKLSGKAKGSSLWITFSYEILEGNNKGGNKYGQSPAIKSGGAAIRSFNSLPSSPQVGVLRKKSASVTDFGSPAVSEPGNELYVEHLDLDDDERKENLKTSPRKETPKEEPTPSPRNETPREELRPVSILKPDIAGAFEPRGRSLFPEIDSGVSSKARGRSQSQQTDVSSRSQAQQTEDDSSRSQAQQTDDDYVKEPEFDSSRSQAQQTDHDPEFNVVDKGVEVEHVDFDVEDIAEEYEEAQEEQQQEVVDWQAQEVQDEENEEEEEEGNQAQEEQDDAGIIGYDWKDAEEEEVPDINMLEDEVDETEPSRSYVVRTSGLVKTYKSEPGGLVKTYESEPLVKTYESSDEADLVAGEFLGMLDEPGQNAEADDDDDDSSDDDEPDSPRAMLLKQFEQETAGFGLDIDGAGQVPEFNLDADEQPDGRESEGGSWNIDEENNDLAEIMDAAESELQKATQAMRSKARAKMLEDAEAEALLQEWGLNEKAFRESSPRRVSFSTPESSDVIPSDSLVVKELAPLAPGLGTVVPTSDGGSLRSMNTALFQGASNDGKLVMHVSKPVVVPVEMGSTAMDVLRNMASGGTENMAVEAMQAMPLEDITGKSVQQIAMEGEVCFEESKQRYITAALEYAASSSGSSELVSRNSSSGLVSGTTGPTKYGRPQQSRDLVSLDELAPVAMEKIESLAMQGLKIQCDMADEEAPYTIEAASPGVKMLEAGRISEDTTPDGMMAMSLSLDEWMKLDAGIYDETETNDKTLAVLAAHGAAHPPTTTDLILNLENESEQGQKQSGKLGNTVTLAMLVQLRDPLRNFEPVGAPMMALVEAERVLVPPRPRMYKRVAIKGNYEDELNHSDDDEGVNQVDQPQFKITGVHLSGLNNTGGGLEDSKKKGGGIWGNAKQQQSGSRWLVASGMGKSGGTTSKHPLLKNSTSSTSFRGKQASASNSSSLWSISSRLSGQSGGVRNPDVKFGSKKKSFGR